MPNSTLAAASNETERIVDPYTDINRAVNQYVTLVVLSIGFPGNILCFLIWMQKRMRHSSGVYLSALALTDLVFLVLLSLFEMETAWDIITISYPVWCSVFPVLHLVAQYLSPLLVLAFTTERYISICHPFKREKFCTIRRAKIVVVCLILLTFPFGAGQGCFFTMQFTPENNASRCYIRPEVIEGGSKSIFTIYTTICDLMFFFIGNIVVLVLNILVIFEMRRLSRVEQTQLQGNSIQKKSATTVMLLCVSFYQIISTMPVSIAYALYMEYDAVSNTAELGTYRAWMRYYHYEHVLTFIKEYGNTHYAFNIFIYLITGKMFRSELKRLLWLVIGKKRLSANSDYSSLRSSVRATSIKTTKSNWVHTNGDSDQKQPSKDATGETLL